MPKTKRKKQSAVHSDVGTPERARHDRYVTDRVATEDTTQRDTRRYINDRDPLEHYRSTRLITGRQKAAGYELRELYHSLGLESHVVGRYSERVGGGNVAGLRIVSLENFQEYKGLLERLLPSQRQAVIRVCCHEEKLSYGGGPHLVGGLRKLQRYFSL